MTSLKKKKKHSSHLAQEWRKSVQQASWTKNSSSYVPIPQPNICQNTEVRHVIIQNVARTRAHEFGLSDLPTHTPINISTESIASSLSSELTILVRTTASKSELNLAHSSHPEDGDDVLPQKPRGFFADQFEVCFFLSIMLKKLA